MKYIKLDSSSNHFSAYEHVIPNNDYCVVGKYQPPSRMKCPGQTVVVGLS